jgi:hypothetical protein
MKELGMMFGSAIVEAIMVLATDPAKDDQYQKRVAFCIDYYTRLYKETGVPEDSDEERGNAIQWLVSTVNDHSYGVIVLLPKDVEHFKKIGKLVDVFKRIGVLSPVSQEEMDEADDIVHELTKIVMG